MKQSKSNGWIDKLLIVILIGALGYAGWSVVQYIEQPTSYTITWSTENELDILGFNVYRADSADGPYERLNSAPIQAQSDPMQESAYTYDDVSAESGQTYYYQLETIYRDGQVERTEKPIVLP